MNQMLKVALFALGTRGDVQPYAALAQALQSAGHQPLLITAGDFSKLAGEAGVPSLSLPGDLHATLEDPAFKLLLQQGRFVAIQRHLASVVRGHAAEWARAAAEAGQGHDLIVTGLGGFFLAQAVADKLAIPLVQAHVVPITTTRAFAAPVAPAWLDRAGRWLRAGSYPLVRKAALAGMTSAERITRGTLGLGAKRGSSLGKGMILYGISPAVLPRPVDWPNTVQLTGYWFLESQAGYEAPEDVRTFLDSGEPPVVVTFGSMPSVDPEKLVTTVLAALRLSGRRGFIVTGWSGLRPSDVPASVFACSELPHSWLFPKASAVVHHGGAGTTAASLAAGRPTIVTPVFGDQAFWGRRVATLGAGPLPMPLRTLQAVDLARAIDQATSGSIAKQAEIIGERISAEDGGQVAVRELERIFRVSNLSLSCGNAR